MARVTRSKNIDISEDDTASPVHSNFAFRSSHLAELPNTNVMAHAQENPLSAELKGLKAAYRSAIGGGRKGPKRNKRQNKSKQDSSAEGSEAQNETEALDAQLNVTSVPGFPPSTLQDEQQRFELPVDPTPVPERRTTRRQAAKAQAGQFTINHYGTYQSPIVMTQRTGDIDYITSLFGGRAIGRKYGGSVANEHHLAERALSKSSMEALEDVGNTVALQGSARTLGVNTASPKEDMAAKDGLVAASLAPREHTPGPPSPTKSPIKTLEEVERSLLDKVAMTTDDEEDSFVEQIIARSPAKPVSRIEDSVEALDQLEEALEALDEAALAEAMLSPEKTRQKPHRGAPEPIDLVKLGEKRRSQRKPLQEDTFRPLPTRSQSTKASHSSVRIKPTATKAPVVKKATSMIFRSQTPSEASTMDKSPLQPKPRFSANKRPISMIVKSSDVEKSHLEPVAKAPPKRPISYLPPREIVKSSKPVTKASFELPGEAISRKLKEQREARQARKDANEESVPPSRAVLGPQVKSTKPLTVSKFELPGEALARRRKEALESRLKAEEEEGEQKRREAKTLRKTVAPNTLPRETAASRARHGLENMIENGTTKRHSIISNVGAHRPSLAQAIIANTAAPRAPGPAPTLTRKPSTISASGINMSGKAMQRTVSATDVQFQRQRAKEAYNRDAKLTEEIERERREREAAAKRAREEAAERGRQASREWADRQMAKKMAESDKGMSGGYGPGGQMGLRA